MLLMCQVNLHVALLAVAECISGPVNAAAALGKLAIDCIAHSCLLDRRSGHVDECSP